MQEESSPASMNWYVKGQQLKSSGLRESGRRAWETSTGIHSLAFSLSQSLYASTPPPPPQWSGRLDRALCHQDPLHFPGPNLLLFFHLDFPSCPQSPPHLGFNLSFKTQLKYHLCPRLISHPPTYFPISCSYCSCSPFFCRLCSYQSRYQLWITLTSRSSSALSCYYTAWNTQVFNKRLLK